MAECTGCNMMSKETRILPNLDNLWSIPTTRVPHPVDFSTCPSNYSASAGSCPLRTHSLPGHNFDDEYAGSSYDDQHSAVDRLLASSRHD